MLTRMVVVSDTHGDRRALRRVLEQQTSAHLFVHLGDGERDMHALLCEAPAPVLQVAGNCDLASLLPEEELIRFADVTILATHGHTYGVKHGLERLAESARRQSAKIALFGHTHQSYIFHENGLFLVNPGSLGHGGTYAVIDFQNHGIFPHIIQHMPFS